MCWPEAGTQTARLPNGSEKQSRNLKKESRRCDWKEREVQAREGVSCVHTLEFDLFSCPEEPSDELEDFIHTVMTCKIRF